MVTTSVRRREPPIEAPPPAETTATTRASIDADGQLIIDGRVVCPHCLEDKGSSFCCGSGEDTFAAAWADYLRAAAPQHSVGWDGWLR